MKQLESSSKKGQNLWRKKKVITHWGDTHPFYYYIFAPLALSTRDETKPTKTNYENFFFYHSKFL